MKRVRYAIGALGMAPALGLMIPAAAHAAATAPQAPQGAGKTVSLEQRTSPLVTCGNGHYKTTLNNANNFRGTIHYSGTCIRSQQAVLYFSKKGLTERTRFYSGGGTLERTTWQAGHIFRGFTSWYSLPNMYAHEVCEALVLNSNHNTVKYGPDCETT
jgi:hypothetical protein